MFSWFRKKYKNEEVLEYVKAVLFPPLEEHEQDGTKFCVDYSIDANLQAVYNDIQDGQVDDFTKLNLEYCLNKLYEVRKQYGIYPEINHLGSTPYYYEVSANR